ncbi:hypothetical protein PN466_18695 [Roseofilum reptotaenium CS-1145]|uniref:Uncharacterized protein n=1 Tax=Roseofilum reptotaenium AO1-A TaxID=1925591 RepID=A0A1L9QTL9_9CYAN|nr:MULTISPECIES: hypothetical protein [Roseofilum]MBP0028365.1 hypothetical protein [Roseofilum sp. Guam]MDB9518977.1 hypothetical protein [Roseofilum reptotaenium CS-1145]OJJ25982.1 hypothetical protein BI308_08465 [Roseofilum reptotaenium AO1-A]
MNSRLPVEFLTEEEAMMVDSALLSSADKFSTRLAIYACRALREISLQTHQPAESISEEAIADWVKHDPHIQKIIDLDESFINFFARLVSSARVPLNEIAQEIQVKVTDLKVIDIVFWFEKDRRIEV